MADETTVEQPPQDVPYVDRVYSALKDNLSGFDKTPEQFKTAMKDSGYAAKAYSALKDNLSGFDKSENDFYSQVGLKKKQSTPALPNGADLSGSGLNPFQPTQAPTDLTPVLPENRQAVREQQKADAHSNAISVAQQQRQTVQPTTAPPQERGVMDKISQALYVPAIKQGFNDLIVSPAAGATDFIDRTIDKAYQGITGEQTPDWLRKKGFFHDVNKQIQQEYDTRDKPKNMVSDIAEGVAGTLPLMASMFTGEGEASLATKAPQLFGRLAKTLATTKGLTAYKDATDNHEGYLQSLEKGAEGAAKGGVEGQFMDAQMLIGGALGKNTANILAERGWLKGGKATQAILHALSVGTVFGGTSAGEDLLQGKDINTDEALKQFGTGLAFELIPTAQGINAELKDRGDAKKINNQAAQAAAVANSASNMNGESALRTLINTPIEQIAQVHNDIPKGHEDLYADSIEKGAQAYDAKSPIEKKDLYTQQLALKAQGDIKMIADKVKQDPTEIINSINENDEISPEAKTDLLNKIQVLTPAKNEPITTSTETTADVPGEPAEPAIKAEDSVAPIEVNPEKITVNEVMDKPVTYHGEPAELIKDGQTLVAKIKGTNREYELGNANNIGDTSIKDLGIEHEGSVVDNHDNGNLIVRGKEYVNNYSDPKSAINYDGDGNVVSVNLETTDGAKRAFKGNVAEDIAYQIHLKELNKDNETKQQFEQFVEQHEPAKAEVVARENEIAAESKPVADNETISRKPAKEKPIKKAVKEVVPIVEDLSPEDAVRKSIETETSPKKIAAQYHNETSAPDYIEKGIIDYLGKDKINMRDYERYGDRNNITEGKRLRWLDTKNSDRTGLDQHAEILSHELGVQVTPEDFIETIDRYAGRKNFEEANKSDMQKLLEDRYQELTGKKLTPRRAENAHNKAIKLNEQQSADFNKSAKEIGFTEQDFDNYEQYRKATEPGAGKPGNAEPTKDKVQQPKNEQWGRKEKDSGGKRVQSLSESEASRLKELRKKFAGQLNDVTRIPTLLADKEFREYAGLVFKDTLGDFKAFSKRMVSEVGEKIKDHLPGLFKELGGKLPEEDAGGEVKKTVLTKRAYEGEVSDDVKRYLEDKGLTRQSFTQEERSSQAKTFIKEFGEDAALKAVEAGDIKGGMAASVLAQLQIRNSRAMDKLAEGSPEREALAKKQSDIIALMGELAYSGGEFNGQLAHEYQDAELNYANVKKQVEKLTGRPLTPGQDIKIKKLTSENEKLRNKLKEAEAKLIDETDKAFETDKPEPPVKPKTDYAKKALDAVVNVRAKIRANSYSDATGMIALVDSGLATIEAGIRTGMAVSKAIERGIEQIKKELQKRGIDIWEKEDKFREDVTKAFADEGVVDDSAEQDLIRKQQANIKRLERELENAKNDRLKDAPTKREPSPEEEDLKQQIKTEKLRISRENMQESFVDKKDNKFTRDEAKDIWGYMKGEYLDNGEAYKDALSKTAQDLGLSWRQVSEAITTPKTKRISDEVWERQAEYARNNNVVKQWVGEQNQSDAYKLLKKISGTVRGLQVFGHGHVFIGTHAGMTLFNPRTTATTIKAFFNGWKLAYGKEASYERAMEELKNSPNYVIAQRAGLKNNPDHINGEEYQKNQHYLGRLGVVGERGFNAIKILRQNLFDREYSMLTPAEQADPEVAKSIAHIMNLATGATTIKLPEAINEVTFAGGMEAARWQKLLGSPAKAANTAYNAIVHPEKASVSDRVFAKIWARRVGQQLATYTAAMVVNSAIQSLVNPKNPVNFTDPDKPDFMKFKFGDTTVDPTSGMRSAASFLYKLGKIGFEDEKNLRGDKRSTLLGKDVAKYSLGKLAPLYGTIADFYNRQDFNGNVMPFSNDKPASYAHKLTWGEYVWQKSPLPIAEAANVTYQAAFEHGANKVALNNVMKGVMTGALSGATGFRVGEFDANSPANNKDIDKPVKHLTGPDGTGYVLTDEQAKERQKLNDDFIAKHKDGLTKRFTREALHGKELKEDIRKSAIGWERNELSAKEQADEKQKMVDDYIQSKIKEAANAHSKPIILKKYKKDGKYLLNKSE